jgi:hypothetical protein
MKFVFNQEIHMATVWQGNFKDNQLHGFGRKMIIHFEGQDGVFEAFTGNWHEDNQHGWIQAYFNNGHWNEMMFEYGFKIWDNSHINAFDPERE